MKKTLFLAIALFALFTIMKSEISADVRTIDTVDISVIAPVSGATPQNTIVATDEYTGSITWSPDTQSQNFKYGITYTAVITLTSISNYKFNVNMTIEKAKVNSAKSSSITNGNDEVGNILTIKKTFTSTQGLGLIKDGIKLINNVEPSQGEAVESPTISIDNDDKNKDNYTVELLGTWIEKDSNDGIWETEDQPRYKVKLSCKDGYVFKSSKTGLAMTGITVKYGRVSIFSFTSTDNTEVVITISYTKITEKQEQEALIIKNKPNLDKMLYGDNSIQLETTGGTIGAEVTWTATSSEEYANVTTGGILKPIKSDGTDSALITLTASMAGNKQYKSVISAPYTIKIEQRELSVTSIKICKVYDKTMDFSIDNIKEIVFENLKDQAPSIIAIEGGVYNSAEANEVHSINGITKIILDNTNYKLPVDALNNKSASIDRAKLTIEPILVLEKKGQVVKDLNIIDFIKINGLLKNDNMNDYFNMAIKDVENKQNGISISWYKLDGINLLNNFPNKNGSYIYKISAKQENIENYMIENCDEATGLLKISGIATINDDEDEAKKIMSRNKQHNFSPNFFKVLSEITLDILNENNTLVKIILQLLFHPSF